MQSKDNFVVRIWETDLAGRCVEERTFVFPSTVTLGEVSKVVFLNRLQPGEFRVTPAEISEPKEGGQ